MFKNYFNFFKRQKNIKFSYWYVNLFMANILFYFFIVCFNLQFIYFSSTSVIDIIFFIFLVIFDIIFFWSFFSDLFQTRKLVKIVKSSPISIINGALGTGKTLLMTYLSQIAKFDNVYSNYFINDEKIGVLGLNHLDFKNKKYKIPPDDSLILFDEIFLYMNGAKPEENNKKFSGLIPYFLLCRQFDNNIVFAGQRINQNWIEYREITNMIIVPMQCIKPSIFFPYFKMKIGFFDDLDDYLVWKTETVKRTANGKRVRKKSNKDIGINFVKIKIPLSIAMQYDSKYLKFVRDLKNDKVPSYTKQNWPSIVKKDITLNELREMGMEHLLKNLGELEND
ncbi:hypothetical protein [Spiroplasma citri]|uniref:hypothetical protein n=1 Tax=Spiroplasma citri TaxID=2133 RepID=UPI0013A084E3|nr:hypothetical protein [Spiroplasma citri]QIA67488.1 hypothetical protein GMI18_07540 [Spiroplasma citri]